nr:NADH dehydrogenase subunit 4L [Tripetaloceroides tonkinensis]
MYFIYSSMLVLVGLYVYCSVRSHLLLLLLSLEYMMLGVFFFVFLYLSGFDCSQWFLVVFLVSSVCEGALGLSVLVSMIRVSGSDYVYTFSLFLC